MPLYDLRFALLLALFFGLIYAALLHWTPLGKFIRAQMTWFATGVGIGVDLLILLYVADDQTRVVWWHIWAVITASAIGAIIGGIWEIFRSFEEIVTGILEDGRHHHD